MFCVCFQWHQLCNFDDVYVLPVSIFRSSWIDFLQTPQNTWNVKAWHKLCFATVETKRPFVNTRVQNISLDVNFQFSRTCSSLFSFQRNRQCFKKPHIFKTSLSCSSLFSDTNTHRQSKSNRNMYKNPNSSLPRTSLLHSRF